MMPKVSVIVPCRNEERTIRLLLEAIMGQSFPQEALEIIIADGMSTDSTRAVIAEFQATHPDLRLKVVDNLKRNIPAAVNAGIRAAEGELLLRLDAHSVPHAEYIARCYDALMQNVADVVGGVWDIQAQENTWIARSIAAAAAHPLAVGDAQYRHGKQAGYVDTVPFGAFKCELVQRIGMYDETLLSNEDYEFNTRVRQAGGKIWLDPQIRCVYFARRNLKELASQYWRYGYWKAQMLKRYPGSLRLRQALPPLFVLGMAVLLTAGLFWQPFLLMFVGAAVLYTAALAAAGIQLAAQKKDAVLAFGFPLAAATMHFCWGAGLLAGLVSKSARSNGRSKV
ncbi:MAG TPA: glycosyltransferase family 2 protein [Anaerolineaceae bacterium]|nr:glycosyltransferase family 2 protein [Anaerolineaceae bacterium]